MNVAALHMAGNRSRKISGAARLVILNGRNKEPAPTPEMLIDLIVAVAQRQDREAFAQLFAYFAPRVKSFLMRSGLDAPAAEDLAQDVMITVWRKASYFDPALSGASTWVFTIARNRKIDRLRHMRARPVDILNDPSDARDTPPSAEELALMSEREERVRRAVASLSREQGAIVQLSFFSEKPHAEIARELGIPLGTVKSRVRLALTRLRALLDSDS